MSHDTIKVVVPTPRFARFLIGGCALICAAGTVGSVLALAKIRTSFWDDEASVPQICGMFGVTVLFFLRSIR